MHFNDILAAFNLEQIINEPTRITDSSSSLLDLIITNYTDEIMKSGTVDFSDMGLDHDMVYCNIAIDNEKPEPLSRTFRPYTNIDKNIFDMEAQLINWK